MQEDGKKRTNIEDLPRAEEEVTNDEAKEVQGGASTQRYLRDLLLDARSTDNTAGGAAAVDPSNPSRKMGDGSV